LTTNSPGSEPATIAPARDVSPVVNPNLVRWIIWIVAGSVLITIVGSLCAAILPLCFGLLGLVAAFGVR
jgi:hypothetical protein